MHDTTLILYVAGFTPLYGIFALAFLCTALFVADAHAQEDIRLSTFQEIAQVLVDRTFTGNITASVTLQSTNNQEIRIPSALVGKILDQDDILSVILTNREGCGVLGVSDSSCILVNTARTVEDSNIFLIQDAAKDLGDGIIDDLNSAFDTDARYHSGYLHHRDEANQLLGTSGSVSGRDVVSVIYVMPKEDTHSMYDKISALLLDRRIRDSGGFFDAALSLASGKDSDMALSIIPMRDNTLYQLRVSAQYAGAADTDVLRLLDYLGVNSIERSKFFNDGFYPLNSLFHLILLSPEPIGVHSTNAGILSSTTIENETIPIHLDRNGWLFDSMLGTKIEGKYLFGTTLSAGSSDLAVTLGPPGSDDSDDDAWAPEGYVVVAAIAAASAIAAAFYLRGYGRAGSRT